MFYHKWFYFNSSVY